jgi:hypothetical protein
MSHPEPTPPWTVPGPVEQSEAELASAFRMTVEHAVTWADSEEKRDQVMNTLYGLFTAVEPDVGEHRPL